MDERTRRSAAPPLKRPCGAASTTLPDASAPAGTTIVPFTSIGFAKVAPKRSPLALIFDPTAFASRTVTIVPAGNVTCLALARFEADETSVNPLDGELEHATDVPIKATNKASIAVRLYTNTSKCMEVDRSSVGVSS